MKSADFVSFPLWASSYWLGCANRRWENRFVVLPQRTATLCLQWRHIGFPSSTAFPSSAAFNPKWSQMGKFELLFLTIPYSVITQKMRKNVWLPSDTLCCLICICVLVRNMADLTADARYMRSSSPPSRRDLSGHLGAVPCQKMSIPKMMRGTSGRNKSEWFAHASNAA